MYREDVGAGGVVEDLLGVADLRGELLLVLGQVDVLEHAVVARLQELAAQPQPAVVARQVVEPEVGAEWELRRIGGGEDVVEEHDRNVGEEEPRHHRRVVLLVRRVRRGELIEQRGIGRHDRAGEVRIFGELDLHA